MILAIKDGQFHKINSPVKVVEVIQNDNHPLVRTWMVKDAIAKHRKLFGWKLIEEKKQEIVKSNSRINPKTAVFAIKEEDK